MKTYEVQTVDGYMSPATIITCDGSIDQIKVIMEKVIQDEFSECIATMQVIDLREYGIAGTHDFRIEFSLDEEEQFINMLWVSKVRHYTMDDV